MFKIEELRDLDQTAPILVAEPIFVAQGRL